MIRLRRWEVARYDRNGAVVESRRFFTRSRAADWQDWLHAFGHSTVVLTKHW